MLRLLIICGLLYGTPLAFGRTVPYELTHSSWTESPLFKPEVSELFLGSVGESTGLGYVSNKFVYRFNFRRDHDFSGFYKKEIYELGLDYLKNPGARMQEYAGFYFGLGSLEFSKNYPSQWVRQIRGELGLDFDLRLQNRLRIFVQASNVNYTASEILRPWTNLGIGITLRLNLTPPEFKSRPQKPDPGEDNAESTLSEAPQDPEAPTEHQTEPIQTPQVNPQAPPKPKPDRSDNRNLKEKSTPPMPRSKRTQNLSSKAQKWLSMAWPDSRFGFTLRLRIQLESNDPRQLENARLLSEISRAFPEGRFLIYLNCSFKTGDQIQSCQQKSFEFLQKAGLPTSSESIRPQLKSFQTVEFHYNP